MVIAEDLWPMDAFVGGNLAIARPRIPRWTLKLRGRVLTMSTAAPGYRVLQTNDDGYNCSGLTLLRNGIDKIKSVSTIVVAPATNQSACGQRLTLTGKMDLKRHDDPGHSTYSLNGTPSDCAILALDPGGIAHDPSPSLVVSGINLGSNMSHDVLYSGTFAAARQAGMLGYPAVATSLTGNDFSDRALGGAVSSTVTILLKLFNALPITPPNPSRPVLTRRRHNRWNGGGEDDAHTMLFDAFCHGDIVININTPPDWSGEYRCTTLGARAYREVVQQDAEKEQMWLGGVCVEDMEDNHVASDISVTKSGHCSITTLQTWPDTHPFRVPDALLKAAQQEGPSGLPTWIERVSAAAVRR